MSENHILDDCCDRCGAAFTDEPGVNICSIHVATSGTTTEEHRFGDKPEEVIPVGTFYHGDSWYQLCGECCKSFQEWFPLFLDRGSEY